MVRYSSASPTCAYFASGRCLPAPGSPHVLRRLSKSAQEGATHSVAIGETCLPGDDFDGMATLLHHQPSGLESQVLDRLGWRLAGLGPGWAGGVAGTAM